MNENAIESEKRIRRLEKQLKAHKKANKDMPEKLEEERDTFKKFRDINENTLSMKKASSQTRPHPETLY